MGIHSLSLNHADHGLDVVARAARDAEGAEALFAASPHVSGAFVLSTCNRVDVYLDVLDELDAEGADAIHRAVHGGDVSTMLQGIAQQVLDIDVAPTHRGGDEAIEHLHETAAGLQSAVLGEREISGQVRRAAAAAGDAGHMSGRLVRAVSSASKASKEVARATELGRAGRSAVDVGLDLAGIDLEGARALIIGTGSYAGATVAALRTRGVEQIRVHSASGRGAGFARRHGIESVDPSELAAGIAWADLVVACRGLGQPLLTMELLRGACEAAGRRELPVILDMALNHDAAADVRDSADVTYVDLAAVEAAAPMADRDDLAVAREIVGRHVDAFDEAERQREIDPAIARLHGMVQGILVDEMGRLDTHEGDFTPAEVRKMMHHVAARILHVPSSRARAAARAGEGEEYLRALETVLGVGADAEVSVDADTSGAVDVEAHRA